ncbi:MAG: class I SAM-dependent methyltransferase [Pseudonocardia sp.]|nr:class I SAM-dependent methyltransferase [Pseudonocardia sp.]MDN5930815.1 class I SAM-dependent methyltransferase [Pseudonocardia sp.]
MPTDWFDEDVAASYDDGLAPMSEAGIDVLAGLAGPDGRALEFAIGTGRVALPLVARGVSVAGIELSTAMVSRLRAKPGGDEARIPVVVGDMATEHMPGTFDLVYLIFNTIMNLTTQDAQVACFANAARHLRPGGAFVVETGVPALRLLPPGQRYVTFELTAGHVGVDEYDVLTQSLVSHHVTTGPDGSTRRRAIPFRYVWPAELDLMARLAGLRLRERWTGWDQTPFSGVSQSHVSTWIKE